MKNITNGCHSFFPKIGCIPVPNDIHELKFLPNLIDKIPLYIRKMNELEEKINSLSHKVVEKEPLFNYSAIKGLIYKAFFIDMENREYNRKIMENGEKGGFDFEYKNVRWGEIISNRNTPCEICGENRSTDQCHIIPRKYGGTLNADNILILCPTHHRLLDRFMLSRAEYASIKWNLKSRPSQYYAETVTLVNHKKFWERIDKENYSSIPPYEEWKDEWTIYKYTLGEIMNCFSYQDMISKNIILKVLDENIKSVAKQLIKYLLKQQILVKDTKGKFLILSNSDFDYDGVAKECWSSFN